MEKFYRLLLSQRQIKVKAFLAFIILFLSYLPTVNARYYYEEVNVPFNDKNQPVDVNISFKNPCYARDEMDNSIKVYYNGQEIESQIYNLRHTDDTHISSCNVVFLSRGKGKYLIRYGEERENKNYPDHVSAVDSHYSYHLLPGYDINLDYYAIMQDGNCVFSIGQRGNVLGVSMGQKVVKMKDNVKKFELNTWEQMSSFAFFYYGGKEIGTDEKLLGKKVIVDGNLMVRIRMDSSSDDGSIKTTAFYTYYYTPDKNRIFVNFNHETTKECRVYGEKEENGIFAYLMCIKSRSKVIKEINLGDILPYIHVYGKNGVQEYKMDTNPENKNYKWLISSRDNVLLGSTPWVTLDDGKVYAIIMGKNAEGDKVKAVVKQKVDIPGVSVAGGGVSVGRAEEGNIPPNFAVKRKCELYYGKSWKDFESEVKAFYNFSSLREQNVKEVKTYNVSVVIHSPIPSRMEVEIWKGNSKISYSDARFRRAKFSLPSGDYVARVYTKRGRKYIGFRSFHVDGDERLHIFCTFQGRIEIKVNKGMEARLVDNGIVASNISANGMIVLNAPALRMYTLQIVYKGFLMHEEKIFLVMAKHREYSYNLYNLNVEVIDSLGFPADVNLSMYLSSSEMSEQREIEGMRDGSIYRFYSLPPANYTLKLSYRNFDLEKKIWLNGNKDIEINFPVVYKINVRAYDNRGFSIPCRVKFVRNGKEFDENILPPGKYTVEIYKDGREIASRDISLSFNTTLNVVAIENSWLIYAFSGFIVFMIAYFIYRREWQNIVYSLFFSSFLFSWWSIAGYGKTSLYIIPSIMVEMYSDYGKLLSIPSPFNYALPIIAILFSLSIIFAYIKRYRISFSLSIASVILFVIFMQLFSSLTTGSIWGSGMLENASATWGMGTGFYIALLFSLLILSRLIWYEVRRGS